MKKMEVPSLAGVRLLWSCNSHGSKPADEHCSSAHPEDTRLAKLTETTVLDCFIFLF